MAETTSPGFTDEVVRQLLEKHFACNGVLESLPGFCDQNFLLTTGAGEKFIVKIGGSTESADEIRRQNMALSILSAQGFPVPRAIENQKGEDLTLVVDSQGRTLQLRMLSYLPGIFYADVPADRQSPVLWRSLGSLLGRLDSALHDLTPDGTGGDRLWDLANGHATCHARRQWLDTQQLALVDHFLEFHQDHVQPLTDSLPRSVIHNDANDHNLLVDDAETPTAIVGLIDFGDMVCSHTINELAIAAAYALMGHEEPVEVLAHLVAGYHEQRQLSETEIDVLFGLIALRLCTTVCVATTEIKARPDNEYLLISVRPAWDLLHKLRRLSASSVAHKLRVIMAEGRR